MYSNNKTMSEKFKRLQEVIFNNSKSKDWEEARLEWKCVGSDFNKESNCICGQHISNLYYIRNDITKQTLTVGSTCVDKFKNKQMIEYLVVTALEKNYKLPKDERYDKLKEKQSLNGIPLSIRKEVVHYKYGESKITKFEYDFYMNIWELGFLTPKQKAFKQKVNSKMFKIKY